jgi:hypothetical protein
MKSVKAWRRHVWIKILPLSIVLTTALTVGQVDLRACSVAAQDRRKVAHTANHVPFNREAQQH